MPPIHLNLIESPVAAATGQENFLSTPQAPVRTSDNTWTVGCPSSQNTNCSTLRDRSSRPALLRECDEKGRPPRREKTCSSPAEYYAAVRPNSVGRFLWTAASHLQRANQLRAPASSSADLLNRAHSTHPSFSKAKMTIRYCWPRNNRSSPNKLCCLVRPSLPPKPGRPTGFVRPGICRYCSALPAGPNSNSGIDRPGFHQIVLKIPTNYWPNLLP